jgi:DNA-binding LytR/AlgR family response regulator
MSRFRVAIVDDNLAFLKQEEALVKTVLGESGAQVLSYVSPEAFLADLAGKDYTCSLYILDVSMPGKDGFEVARAIRERDREAPILFLTDYRNEAIRGYEVQARYYLLKDECREKLPILLPALFRDWQKARNEVYRYEYDNQIRLIPLKDILYLRFNTWENQLVIKTTEGELRERKALRTALAHMDTDEFVLVEKGCAVNLRRVTGWGRGEVELQGKYRCRLSRNYQADFNERMSEHLKQR